MKLVVAERAVDAPPDPMEARWGIIRLFPLALGLILVGVLAAFKLANYPATFFDEGINLLAARELATTGRYGMTYSGAFHPFPLSMSTGPTVIVPIALVFKVLGVGLVQGRLVMVAYLLLAALGLAVVANQLYGPIVSAVTLFASAAVTQAGFFAIGRVVLGEIPALAFLYWGTAAFIQARRTKSIFLDLAAGLLLGLAILTKNELVLITPIVLYAWAVGRQDNRGFPFWRLFLVGFLVVAPTTLWYILQVLVMGPSSFLVHLRGMSETASTSAYVAPLARTASAATFLISSGFIASGGAGLAYIWLLIFQKKQGREPAQVFLPAFVTFWLFWFLGFSMGYARYAVPASLTASLFAAKLLVDLGATWTPLGRLKGRIALRPFLDDALGTGLLVVLAASVLIGIFQNALTIARSGKDEAQAFAATVMQRVPSRAVVDNMEWEIDFLTNRTYHHPPSKVVDDTVSVVFLGQSAQKVQQEYQVPADSTYLIDGPFSKAAGVYQPEIERGEFVRIASVGPYDLYRRARPAGLAQ